MKTERLCAYRHMWLFVFFDLPVGTKAERKAATGFRNKLLKDGFSMLQFSVYVRHCPSLESAEAHRRRVTGFLPDRGLVSVLSITDKQFGNMLGLWGKCEDKNKPQPPPQLELF